LKCCIFGSLRNALVSATNSAFELGNGIIYFQLEKNSKMAILDANGSIFLGTKINRLDSTSHCCHTPTNRWFRIENLQYDEAKDCHRRVYDIVIFLHSAGKELSADGRNQT